MIKHILSLSLIAIIPSISLADQVINLKDGSQIRGELVSMVNGVYTVKTQNLGQISINAANVVSVASTDGIAPAANTAQPQPISKQDVDAQFQKTQAKLMSNPEALADIQELANDPEIMKMLSDPALVQSVTNRDVNAIQTNPKTQALLNNPKMKALMEKIQSSSPSN